MLGTMKTIKEWFAGEALEIVEDVSWREQPAFLDMERQVLSARRRLEAAEGRFQWLKECTDPHVRRWVERFISPEEEMKAHAERGAIEQEVHLARLEHEQILQKRAALVQWLQQEIAAMYERTRRAMLPDVVEAVGLAAAANSRLIALEVEARERSGLAAAFDPAAFYGPLTEDKFRDWKEQLERHGVL